MRELEENFIGKGQVKGFKFTQIKKNEYAYIYEVDYNGLIHYEVFKRVINKMYDCVSYPRNKSFGSWAKTYKNLDKALLYFEELTNKNIDHEAN